MNDKILSMAFMLFFIMIGINAFLYMASTNLYTTNGEKLNIYYGMDDYANSIINDTQETEIGTSTDFSSDVPSQTQGITAVTRDTTPVGVAATNDLTKIGIGVQLVLLKLSTMFPILTPITTAIIAFAFAIQGFAVAYLGSILIRGILGRIT